MITSKGTKTTSRTAQALVSVTARHLTGHKTIARLVQRSAARRLARFNVQGRKAKLMEKVERQSEVSKLQATTSAPVGLKKGPKKKTSRQGAKKQIAKNVRRQERVRKLISIAEKRKK